MDPAFVGGGMRKWLLGTAALSALAVAAAVSATPSQADPVFALGSTFTVTGQDFPFDFSAETATLGTPTITAGGQLSVGESFTPVGATQEWVVFDFASVGGNPVIGPPALNFSMSIDGFQTTGPAVLSDPFAYFTFLGTPFEPLTPASGFGVETNPITGTGDVLDFVGFSPGAPSSTFHLDILSDPAAFLTTVGVDPAMATDFHFGALLTLTPVPEPDSLAILGIGLFGFAALRLGRRKI